jgi:hypothetical protein
VSVVLEKCEHLDEKKPALNWSAFFAVVQEF